MGFPLTKSHISFYHPVVNSAFGAYVLREVFGVIREQTKLRIEVSKKADREEKCRTEALAKILVRVLTEQSTCPVKEKQPENRSVRTL